MILMKYHALFVIFEKKKQQNLKLSSAANNRWRSKGLILCILMDFHIINAIHIKTTHCVL